MKIEIDKEKGLRSWEIASDEVWCFFITVMLGFICVAAVSCERINKQPRPAPPPPPQVVITATPVPQ